MRTLFELSSLTVKRLSCRFVLFLSHLLSVVTARMKPYYQSVLPNSSGEYCEVMVEGAEHEDFFDITFLTPKWLSMRGEIALQRVIKILNKLSLRFFDAYLKEGTKPRFSTEEFPEFRVRMNKQIRE